MPDFFMAGYGSVWLPPVSRGYVWPGSANQNGTSAGYDPFDRFDLGKPGAETAYGTEQGFGAVVGEFKLAASQVFIDIVLNHNAGRQTGAGFMNDGGYPGFWMNPPSPMRDKLPTDDWGDFHQGNAQGYRQSTNPNDPNYCLLAGDLVALIDIDHGRSNLFIRQPVEEGNPQNIPAGQYFNRPNPDNRRFYPDAALGTDAIANPGMWTLAGELSSPPFGPFPCNVPGRDAAPSVRNLGRFNLLDPMAGDPVPENANDYLLRWVQWMLDVHQVDGFRIDAVKHMPSWFYDNLFDAVVHERRLTPDGRFVTPFSFGECVEGNAFCFDRYIRKPNGRTTGRSAAGDAYGNRDALDLTGAGYLRGLATNAPWASFANIEGEHIDSADDGFNNGTLGVNHIWSHDNGSWGDGTALPGLPPSSAQGWFMHAYLVMRPGQAKIYHNARGLFRTGVGFYPREGVPVALGWDANTGALNPVITNLVQLSNWYGRGEYNPLQADDFTKVFERRTGTGTGYSGNVVVGINRRFDGAGITSFDSRWVPVSFPPGTRLIEMTGNAADPTVDPTNQIPEVAVVNGDGWVEIRVPRNQNINGATHSKGFVVYGPAIPSGQLTITNTAATLAPDVTGIPDHRQRLTPIPVVNADSFEIRLSTVNGDSGAPNNNNADDNAVFRINQGYEDWNGNGVVDIEYTNSVVPGYEQFVTLRQPLAGTANANGQYHQLIDATRLPEGLNYVSVVAFRKRNVNEAPLFREFRTPVYVDRLPPAAEIVNFPEFVDGTSFTFDMAPLDRTVNRVHLILNPPTVSDPLTLANVVTNGASRIDRSLWRRTLTGFADGPNTVLLLAFEESGRGFHQYYTVNRGAPEPDCIADFNGDDGVDDLDIAAFFAAFETGEPNADVNNDDGIDDLDIIEFFVRFEQGC